MHIEWNTVTWYSKLLAVIFLLGFFPALTFYIGIQYQQMLDASKIVMPIYLSSGR